MSTLKKTVRSLINRILVAFRATAAAVATLGLAVGTIPLTTNAADVYWDPDLTAAGNNEDGTGLGGDGTWDTTAPQWWDATGGSNSAWNNFGDDIGIFSYPLTLPSALPSFFSVNLGTPISAGGLSFMRSGYTLSGSALTLTGDATLRGSYGTETTISSQISGTDGLTVTGGGTFFLTNSANDFTGGISIDNGTVIVTDIGALGNDTGLIDINGSSTRSLGAGSLVVDATAGPIDITREIDIQGRGPITDRGTTFMSYGDVTLSSTAALETQKGFTNTRMTAVEGLLSITSDINNSGGQYNTYATFGGINDVSAGNYAITGALSGDGSIEKSGSGRLLFDPSDSSGFSGTIRISGSSFDEGGIRIINDGVLGTRTGTGSITASNGAVLDLNNGMLEVRMDAPSLTAGGAPANVYQRVNGTISVDNAANDTGIALGGTLVLGDYRTDDDRNFILEGRNGFNVTIGDYTEIGGTGDETDIFNRLEGGGLFTIDGDANFQNSNVSTQFRFENDGDTLITGSLVPSGTGSHTLRKNGLGTLTIEGTNSSNMSVLNILRGTVAVTDFRSLGGVTSILIDGNASQGSNGLSTLEIGTSQTPGSIADLTTSAAISITGGNGQDARILANQSGSVGVTFSGDITSTVDGASRDLILGGTNTADNTISGDILQSNTSRDIRLWKVGSGTWVLSGAGNAYESQTLIQNGILKAQANAITSTIIPDTSDIRFVTIGNVPGPGTSLNDLSAQRGGGTFEFVGNAGENNVETVGNLDADDGSNTVRLTPGAGGTASLVFAGITEPNNDSTINLVAPTAGDTFTFTAYTGSTTDAFNAGVYYNGSDFALIGGAGVAARAPIYGTDAGFVNASTALTSLANNNVIADFSQLGAITIKSLRIDGSTTNTLTLGGTTTIWDNGANNNDGGIILTGGDATITGSALSTGAGAAGTGDIIVRVEGASNTLTIDSNINGDTDGSFIKSGEGTVVVTGSFSNAGVNAINEGTVIIGTGGNLSNRNLFIGQDATLDLNGNDETTRSFDINGTLTNTSATAVTLTVGNGNQGGTSNGTISETNGQISVVKIGTANQSWDGISDYTGSTTISSTGGIIAHTLANIGEASSIGRGDNTSDATNAASLIFTGASASGDFGALEYDGWDAVSTDRLFTFGGTAANSGVAIESNGVNQANIVFSNTGTLAFGAGTDDVDQTLRLGGSSRGDNVFLPQITDNPNGAGITSVLKNEGGVWTLGGNNTYTGTTTINAGRLIATDGVGIHADSGVLIDNGMWLSSGTITRDLVGTLTGAANEIAFGATGNQTGFGSAEGDLVVTLSGGAPLTWGGDFMPVGSDIRFNNLESYGEVDFTNDINLGAVRRNIRVTNNQNAAGDFATLSGDLSGTSTTGGILFDGSGTLRLTGDNSYTGSTDVRNGTLIVKSLGNSTSGPATSSVGATANANLIDNGVILRGGGNSPAQLVYTGTGEVSDRYISLESNGGNGNQEPHLYASGTGAIVLTNVVNNSTVSGRQLYLRGNNAAGNMISSVIGDGAGAFQIVVDGSATWILSGQNTYTGVTSVNSGALGVTNSDSLGTGTISLNNGIMFAHGNDVTINNNIEIDNNTGPGFIGEHSLTFTDATVTKLGNNNWSINNSIDNTNGAQLTFQGDILANALNSTRVFTAGGTGVTEIQGSILNTSGQNINLNRNNGGTLRLVGTSSEFNAGIFTIDNGVIQMGADEVIPHGAGEVDNILFDPEGGETATLDLNGFSETVNRVTTQDSGDSVIDNTGATDGTFTFGADDSVSVFGNNTTITDSGTGTLSLQKTGAGVQTIGTGVDLTYEGTTGVDGGSLTVQANLQSTSGLSASNGGTLTVEGELQSSESLSVVGTGSVLDIDGVITNAAGITSVTVDNGGTLDLVNSSGDKLTGVTTLSLAENGDITLNLEAGDITGNDEAATDTIGNGTVVAATGGNMVTINITDLGINADGTSVYSLIEANDGLDTASYVLGTTPAYLSGLLSISFTNDLVQLETTAAAAGQTLYWDGSTDNSWNSAPANWSTVKAGGTDPLAVPGINDDVIFTADSVAAGALTTTLDADFRINSLTFESNTNGTAPITIAQGSTGYLAIAPGTATDGIEITSGGPDATISAPLRILADQEWDVQDAASSLTISGGLQGEANVTVVGSGTTTISAAADATLFNGGGSSTFTVTNGTLIDTNGDGLGAGANAADIVIGSGGVYYATAGSPDNDIELAGGTLSTGAASRTYEGDITVSSASFINTRGNNSAVTTDEGQTITFTGNVTGTGSITLQGETDGANDGQVIFNTNPAAGTGADTSGFSGDLFLEQGEIRYDEFGWNGANDFQTEGNITISSDATERALVRWQRPEAERTYNMIDRDITIGDAGGNAVGLFLLNDADETRTGAITSTIIRFDADSVVTLGGAGGSGELQIQYGEGYFPGTTTPRTFFDFLGGIVLANDGIIEAQTDNSITDFAGGVTETMVGSSLTIQGNNTRVIHLKDASTHTGGTILDSGVLRLGDSAGAGTGDLDFAGGAISASTDGLIITNNIVESTADQIFFQGFDDNNITITDDFAIPGARTIRADGDLVNTPLVKETVIFTGAITGSDTSNGNKLTLEGNTSGAGIIRGGYTQSGTAADAAVNGGEWTFDTNTVTIGQILTVNTNDAILNLGTANVLAFNGTAATQQFRIQNGGTLNLGANQAITNLDQLRIGVDSAAAPGTLNTNGFSIGNGAGTMDLLLGQPQNGREGIITGTGTVIADNVDLYEGSITAGLVTGAGNIQLDKLGTGDVTLSGDNTGWTSTGDTRIIQGRLILDYTTDTNQKISNVANSDLDMRGGTLSLNGNGSTGVIEDIGVTGTGNDRLILNQGLGGDNVIELNSNGADVAIRFGQIVRGTNNGTIRFNLTNDPQTATNGVITDETNNGSTGLLDNDVNQAYAIVNDGTGTFFATNLANAANGNIGALASIASDDISNWVDGDNVTDTTGYTGTTSQTDIASLRFDTAADSTVTVADVLGIESGGILLTENVTAGTQSILGGTLDASGSNIIIHHYGSNTFEISSAIRGQDTITHSGTGTTVLSGDITTTGRLNIFGGTVQTSGNLNSAMDVSFSNGSDATWILTQDESIRRLFGGRQDTNQQTGTVNIGTNTLSINYTGGNTNFAGRIIGSGDVIISGNNDFQILGEMSNNNTPDNTEFTGRFIVDGGKVRFDVRADARQASTVIVQNGGLLELDKRGGTREATVFNGSMPITLISADGGLNAAQGRALGLYLRTDQGSNNNENFGNLILGGGTSYVSVDANDGDSDPFFQVDTVVRNNASVLNIKGFDLGNNGNNVRGSRVLIDNANEGAFETANEIGGGGLIGSKNISIIPWAIGQDLTGNANNTSVGNSFLHYDAANGFRALDITPGTGEYDTFATAGATSNVRETSSTNVSVAAATGATTINSLVVDNITTPGLTVTGAGAGESLEITSGGLLFTSSGGTVTGTTYDTTLGGFEDGITTASGEYIFHVVNPDFTDATMATRAVISSSLTSAADITKSGRGVLDLTALDSVASVAGGGANGTSINEGTLVIDALQNIGGVTGALNLAGGTLELATGFADDISGRTVTYLDGTSSTINDGGIDTTWAGSLGSGAGDLTKTGTGNMTLNAASARTGDTTISQGTVTLGASDALGIGGNVSIANAANLDLGANNISVSRFTTTGSGNSTIAGTGTITASEGFVFNHTANTVTVNALLAGTGGIVTNGSNNGVNLNNNGNTFSGPILHDRGTLTYGSISDVGGGASALGSVSTVEDGTIRFGVGGTDANFRFDGNTNQSSDRILALTGTTGGVQIDHDGSGTTTLDLGVVRSDEYGVKNVTLRGATGTGAASIDSIQAQIGDISVVKNEGKTWTIRNDSVYSGTTSVNAGTLLIDGDNSAATGDVTVAGGATLGGTGTIGGAVSVLGGDGLAAPGGTLSAATSGGTASDIGTLTLNSDLSAVAPLNGGNSATWLVDLNNAITGTSDLIALGDISSRTIDLTNFELALNDFGTFNLSTGFTYDIATYTDAGGPLSSTFAGLGEGSQITGSGGGQYFITYGNQDGFGGNDYSIRLTAVPEPTTFLLLLPLLLAGFWMMRRRKQEQLELEEAEA